MLVRQPRCSILVLIMNNVVTEQANNQLVEMFTKGEREHIDWFAALEESITTGVAFGGEKSSHKCEFGVWHDNSTVEDEELSSLLKRFEEPHKRLHSLADKLIGLCDSDQMDEALRILETERHGTLTQLRRLFDDAQTQVTESYKPIIVYTTVDGRTPYIGLLVDSVEDSVNINDDEIKSLNKIIETGFKLNAQTQKMLNGIVKINNKYSLIIDSTAIFTKEDEVQSA